VRAVTKFQECRPDVVLMDLRMPKLGGIEAARTMRGLDPEARIIRVNPATTGDQDIYLALRSRHARIHFERNGACGSWKCYRAVHSGRRLVPGRPSTLAAFCRVSQVALTPREAEVLGLVAHGCPIRRSRRSSAPLPGTNQNAPPEHSSKKLNSSDRTQAVMVAVAARHPASGRL